MLIKTAVGLHCLLLPFRYVTFCSLKELWTTESGKHKYCINISIPHLFRQSQRLIQVCFGLYSSKRCAKWRPHGFQALMRTLNYCWLMFVTSRLVEATLMRGINAICWENVVHTQRYCDWIKLRQRSLYIGKYLHEWNIFAGFVFSWCACTVFWLTLCFKFK